MSGEFSISFDSALPELTGTDYATKSSIDYVVRLTWNEGDEISVINMSTGKALGGNLVADRTGSMTTFSGTLSGTVSQSDQLLFLYPCQDYASETDFSGLSLEGYFEEQDGSSPAAVPFIATAKATLSGLSVSSKPLDFEFGMSLFQMNLMNLPASTVIDEVFLYGFNTTAEFMIEGNELVSEYSEPGFISIMPESLSTNSSGARTVYFTCLPQPAIEDEDREMSVTMGEDVLYGLLPSAMVECAKNYIINKSDLEEISSVDLYPIELQSNVDGCYFEFTGGVDDPEEPYGAFGETITLTMVCADGYSLESLEVLDGEMESVEFEFAGTELSFVMPESSVTIIASFAPRQTPVDGGWNLVTSLSDVHDGDKVVIMAYSSTLADGSWSYCAMSNADVTTNPYKVKSTLVVPSDDFSTLDVSGANGLLELTVKYNEGESYPYQFLDERGNFLATASASGSTIQVAAESVMSANRFSYNWDMEPTVYNGGNYMKIWCTYAPSSSNQPYITSGFYYSKSLVYQFNSDIYYLARLYKWVE